MKIVGHCEARHTSPAIADLKELQLVHKALHLSLREPGLKYDGEHARRACEVPLPELVARAGRKSRVQHAFDLGPLAEPARQTQRGFFNRLQPTRHRLQAYQ